MSDDSAAGSGPENGLGDGPGADETERLVRMFRYFAQVEFAGSSEI
jgi:hypothetical protein